MARTTFQEEGLEGAEAGAYETRRIWETLSAPMHGAGEEEAEVSAVMLLGDQTM